VPLLELDTHSFRGKTLPYAGSREHHNALLSLHSSVQDHHKYLMGLIKKVREEHAEDLQQLHDALACFTVGLDHSDLLRLRMIGGKVHFFPNKEGTLSFSSTIRKQDLQAEDAGFVVTFSTDSVIQIESCIGSLEAPLT